MNSKQRKQLQKATQTAKTGAARFARIAEQGGNDTWDADAARRQARICDETADQCVRQLTNGR